MRKLVITICVTATALSYVVASTAAQAHYYSDGFYGFYGDYGPYFDCNGQRCYIGPPFSDRRYHGRSYRAPGQYYYGQRGGYFHGWLYN